MKKRLLNSSEYWTIVKVILILTLIFGFNDGKIDFEFSNWLKNLILVCLVTSIITLVYVFGLKLSSQYYGTEIEIKVWNSYKFKEAKPFFKKVLLIYTTPILNIIVMLITNGKFYLANVLSFNVKREVFGRKFQYLTYFNTSLIIFVGLCFNLILMWLFKLGNFELGLKLSFWFILFNLIPISELPGAKLLAGSIAFYVFSLFFFLVNIVLLQAINSFASLFISLIFSIIFSMMYFFYFQFKKA